MFAWKTWHWFPLLHCAKLFWWPKCLIKVISVISRPWVKKWNSQIRGGFSNYPLTFSAMFTGIAESQEWICWIPKRWLWCYNAIGFTSSHRKPHNLHILVTTGIFICFFTQEIEIITNYCTNQRSQTKTKTFRATSRHSTIPSWSPAAE